MSARPRSASCSPTSPAVAAAPESRARQAALAADAGEDSGLRNLQAEARQGLKTMHRLRRVLVVGTRPA
jgi:hypothetical protein